MVNTVVCRSHAVMGNSIRSIDSKLLVLFRPELLDSFQEDLQNFSEVANELKLLWCLFCSVLLFKLKWKFRFTIDELNLFTRKQGNTCVCCFRVSVLYCIVLDIHL